MPMPPTLGVILAGGQARRMGGGDKALLAVNGEPVLSRILRVMAPQLTALILNANGDPARFAAFGLPVVPDSVPGHPGPLAGILAGLDWAARHPTIEWVLTLPGDAPFLPPDLAARLHAGRGTAPIAYAASGDRMHPVIALWSVTLRDDLRQALSTGTRRVAKYQELHGATATAWPIDGQDPFMNVNTPTDLAEAQGSASAYDTRNRVVA